MYLFIFNHDVLHHTFELFRSSSIVQRKMNITPRLDKTFVEEKNSKLC